MTRSAPPALDGSRRGTSDARARRPVPLLDHLVACLAVADRDTRNHRDRVSGVDEVGVAVRAHGERLGLHADVSNIVELLGARVLDRVQRVEAGA